MRAERESSSFNLTHMTTRRDFLRKASLASAAMLVPRMTQAATPFVSSGLDTPLSSAQDESYWEEIAALYDITDEVTNLEGGYWGIMSRPVLKAFQEHTRRVNRENSFFARTQFGREVGIVRERVAETLGVGAREIAFSRNATEALQALISQYNRLQHGETVMYADLDYPAMQQAMDELAERKGAHVATLVIPEPAESVDQIVDAYRQALDAEPRTRLLLLTHVNNKTGLVHPVKEITSLARSKGIDVIVDAAHSWGHVPFDVSRFGADYVGMNLHKWIGAPIGVGAMYIRESGLDGIDRAHGDPGPLDAIRSRLHTGTMNFATILTVPDALDFQESIGWERKFERVRYLRDLWVQEARSIEGIDILTPDTDGLVGALTSFRVRGEGSGDENRALVQRLVEEHGIFTVARTGVAGGDCVRVTPALYNLPADLDRFVTALRAIAAA